MNAAWALETGVRLMTAAARGRRIPFQTTLFVTNRCNKKCVYCSIPDDPAPDLSTDAWRTILARLRGAGGRRVLFFGGEPLLRDDIGELVGFARHLGLRAGMTTNGSLVPDRVEAVRNLHSLAVSLDGRPATQERTRGRDSHGEALRAVEIARSCGVPVKLNAVLCADNAAEVPWLLKFSAANRVPLVLNLLRSEETGYHRDAGRHRLEDEAMRELLRTVADAARTHPLMVFSKFTYETARRWPDFKLDRLTRDSPTIPPRWPRCSAGRFHGVVSADGRLYPCPVTLGLVPALSILDDGLEAAWERAGSHDCVACASPCMIETNAAFALTPSVLLNHLSSLGRRPIY